MDKNDLEIGAIDFTNENDKKLRKNIFIKGMLTGVVVTAAVCIISVVLMVNFGIGAFSGKNVTVSLDDITETTSSSELINKISNKLIYLNSIIDMYYLEETDTDELAEGIYAGLFEALDDPYTYYYNKEEYEELKQSINGTYSGIGAVVSQDADTKIITVLNPYKDAPAYKAGMRAGDIVYSVNGTEVGETDVSTVVSWLKGEAGTDVDVTVYRNNQYVDLTIIREEIEIPTVDYQVLDNNVGYIEISQFDTNTSGQFADAMEDLISQNMEGLVIDLRNNPGGVYETVVEMLDSILPEGTIVYTEDKNGAKDVETSDADTILDVPLSVIVNENSASASEIFAGAVKDYGIGTIVGTTTYGKGVVQSVVDLGDGTGIKITTSKYYTPNGVCIHGIGIEPDVEVDVDYIEALQSSFDEDEQLQTAIKVLGLE
ncbi:MAG: S41 family peptidase [Eubacterium sp.]